MEQKSLMDIFEFWSSKLFDINRLCVNKVTEEQATIKFEINFNVDLNMSKRKIFSSECSNKTDGYSTA